MKKILSLTFWISIFLVTLHLLLSFTYNFFHLFYFSQKNFSSPFKCIDYFGLEEGPSRLDLLVLDFFVVEVAGLKDPGSRPDSPENTYITWTQMHFTLKKKVMMMQFLRWNFKNFKLNL